MKFKVISIFIKLVILLVMGIHLLQSILFPALYVMQLKHISQKHGKAVMLSLLFEIDW